MRHPEQAESGGGRLSLGTGLVGTGTSFWNTQGNLLAINLDASTPSFAWVNLLEELDTSLGSVLGSRPSMDETEGDGVGMNTERTSLLGDVFSKANNCGLGNSIVGLTNVSVKTGS